MPEVVEQTGVATVLDWLANDGYTMVMLADGRNMAFADFREECDLSDRTVFDVRDVIMERIGQGFTPVKVKAVKVSPTMATKEARRGPWFAISDIEGAKLAQLNISGFGEWKITRPNGEPLPELRGIVYI